MSENKKITAEMLKPGMIIKLKSYEGMCKVLDELWNGMWKRDVKHLDGKEFEIKAIETRRSKFGIKNKLELEGKRIPSFLTPEFVEKIISTPATDIDVGAKTQSNKMIDGDKLLEFLEEYLLETCSPDFAMGFTLCEHIIEEKILEMQKAND